MSAFGRRTRYRLFTNVTAIAMLSIDDLGNDERLRWLDDDAGVIAMGLDNSDSIVKLKQKTATTLELWL